jgi:hypothetical protein
MSPKKKDKEESAVVEPKEVEVPSDKDIVEDAKADSPGSTSSSEEKKEADPNLTIPVAKMEMPDKMPKYRVLADWKGSYNGQVTVFLKGKIIDPRGHGGLKGIEGLKKAGVELEEVKD